MTARDCFEGLLTELSKVNAPSMLLLDFNYFFNKALYQYINKHYNVYDINQQSTDDLRVLKSSSLLDVQKVTDSGLYEELASLGAGRSKLFDATYEVNLPDDYLHILNCICIYRVSRNYKCYNAGDHVLFAAKRLTADSWSSILNDFYNRPLPERPYFYIHNVNVNSEVPTNPVQYNEIGRYESGTDQNPENSLLYSDIFDIRYKERLEGFEYYLTVFKLEEAADCLELIIFSEKYELVSDVGTYILRDINSKKTYDNLETEEDKTALVQASKLLRDWFRDNLNKPVDENYLSLPRKIFINRHQIISNVNSEKDAAQRGGNPSKVRLEIRYGHDASLFILEKIFVDYIKTPQHIRLTLEQVNLTEDTSQVMEFPDYVCQEIINELVHLVQENTADPRLLTHPVVTTTIASPVQQLQQQTRPQTTRSQQ